MNVTEEFEAGASDYYRGWVPDKWEDKAHRDTCPYCLGWYLESLADLGQLDELESCRA